MNHRSSNAFTIIEILVVIAILAVLISIIIPVVVMARRMGERAVAISNTRQIAQAMLIYSSTNDDAFPVQRNVRVGYWITQIGLVNGSAPSLKDPRFGYVWNSVEDPPEYKLLTGYAVNGCIRPDMSRNNFSDTGRLVMVAPAAFFDITNGEDHVKYPNVILSMPDVFAADLLRDEFIGSEAKPMESFGAKRYFGKGIYAFVDGHAATLHPSAFVKMPKDNSCGFEKTATEINTGPTFALN